MGMFCSNCGSKQKEGTKFCTQCGAPLDRKQAQQTPEKKKSGKKKLWVIFAVAVPLLALAVVGVLFGPRVFAHLQAEKQVDQLTSAVYVLEEDEGLPSYRVRYMTFRENGMCQISCYYALGNELLQWEEPYATNSLGKDSFQVLVGEDRYLQRYNTNTKTWTLLREEDGAAFGQTQSLADPEQLAERVYEAIDDVIDREVQRAAQAEAERAELLEQNKAKAAELFENVRISTLSEYTMGHLLEEVCKEYTLTCEPEEGSETKFVFTVDAIYYPNKVDLDFLTETGTMVTVVDIESGECAIVEDSGILNAMEVYLALGTNWWQDEVYW